MHARNSRSSLAPGRRGPVVTVDHRPQDFDAEQVEVLAEEEIEREELTNNVGEEQQLNDQVHDYKVVAMTTATAAEAGARETVFETDVARRLDASSLTNKVPIQYSSIVRSRRYTAIQRIFREDGDSR